MKKIATTKVITVATSLLSAITGNADAKQHNTEQLNSVRESVSMMQSLANKADDVSVRELFNKVLQLSQKIDQLNASLIQDKFKISPEQFDILMAIRTLLDLNSTILVDKHEARIMSEFSKQYRAYTNSIVELDYSLARVKEKSGLVKVNNIGDLEMSAVDLTAINQAAKERTIR